MGSVDGEGWWDGVSVLCPVCGLEFEVPEGKGAGDTVVCPWCNAELRLMQENGELVAREV